MIASFAITTKLGKKKKQTLIDKNGGMNWDEFS
jgi:hypothetical protein